MAKDLGIGRWWFHKNHYDIPLKRVEEIQKKDGEAAKKIKTYSDYRKLLKNKKMYFAIYCLVVFMVFN